MIKAKEIHISGLVQGVGFRPFIYRLAHEYGLKGCVENNNLGVKIIAEGDEPAIKAFITDIPKRLPQASSVESINSREIEIHNFDEFTIARSQSVSDEITEVSPDISVCQDCLNDMKNQDRRIDYPFTNCTNCGPRFTIIKDLPYDRQKTTMKIFKMCPACEKEYTTILDRRFHAQPVACEVCGPKYKLHYQGKEISNILDIIAITARLLEEGKIIAIKGLGGYHLACSAFNEKTIKLLRERKNREGKPFALMFRNLESADEYLYINKEEKELLTGWRKPVTLLKIKKEMVPSISIFLNTVGAMLPYMPFHYMLFENLKVPAIVLTSGNISDEPIVIDDTEALLKFQPISDAVVTYNREIHNRTDDSVALFVNNKSRLIRRSRSYTPSPIHLDINTEGIFAAGAELVNCFCIGKGKQAIMSQHIGDLKNLETLDFYTESVDRFKRLFRFEPQLAVCDMHPDYLSTHFARELNIPILETQHHHAHIASCMAEYKIDEKVIGISFDGTGYGTDGHVWGGEFFVCDLNDFERVSHFEYIPQPGGDVVTKHPWRMMLSYMQHYFGNDVIDQYPYLFNNIHAQELALVNVMLGKGINCPLTSSAGRLFDAVSALLNICKTASYHAEPPMRLESVAKQTSENYAFNAGEEISFKPTFEGILKDIDQKIDVGVISGKFHNTIVQVIIKTAQKVSHQRGIKKVVLSGGSFQNRILLKKAENSLKDANFAVFSQSAIPSNDGGIALGQLAIAAKRRELGLI
ncbi:MAG: carbamoyltransferase HypF [Bacteroidales bacterium]|jgi:hydrogenase maturation protein HypF|nr:carbamoyltransferase HypF [Bacteroidales bacterium]